MTSTTFAWTFLLSKISLNSPTDIGIQSAGTLSSYWIISYSSGPWIAGWVKTFKNSFSKLVNLLLMTKFSVGRISNPPSSSKGMLSNDFNFKY